MPDWPPVVHQGAVSGDDRNSAIDFVNRVIWFFEVWDVDAMVESFLPDSTTHHFHGIVEGHKGLRRFFDTDYPYLIPGVARLATSHIVDADGPDGVVVRYHNLLVRHAGSGTAPGVLPPDGVVDNDAGLPSIWIYSPMLDRLRRTGRGWRIQERYVGASVIDSRLSPPSM